jgi:hypothetical protein
MSSLAGQFARKVALFVKDEKLNSSEFQLKSTDGDKIVMTDGDDLEVKSKLITDKSVHSYCT